MTIILDSTLRSLKAKTDAGATTTEPTFVASYVETVTASFAPHANVGSLSGTTSVEMVPAPASGSAYQIKGLAINNVDTVSHDVTVEYLDDVTTYEIGTWTVPAGMTLQFTNEDGFRVVPYDLTNAAQVQFAATKRALGRNTAGAGPGEEVTISQMLDWLGTPARGDIYIEGAGPAPTRLAKGSNRQILQIGANDPSWVNGPIQAIQGFRLTLESGVSVSTTDQTGKTTIYLTPHIHNQIALYDGSTGWDILNSAEVSLAVPSDTDTNHDVWAYNNAGTLTLETTAWASAGARATALVRQDGVWVKTGATTRRYVGTIRTTGVSGQCEDSLAKRFVWNTYNRVSRPMRVLEATNSWPYSTAAWRQMNNSTANQLAFVRGLDEDSVEAVTSVPVTTSGASAAYVRNGIGLDSAAGFAAGCIPGIVTVRNSGQDLYQLNATYRMLPGLGYHYLAALEYGNGSDTQTWYGDNNTPTVLQSGIIGSVWA